MLPAGLVHVKVPVADTVAQQDPCLQNSPRVFIRTCQVDSKFSAAAFSWQIVIWQSTLHMVRDYTTISVAGDQVMQAILNAICFVTS